MIGADGLVPVTDGGFLAAKHGAIVLAMIEIISPVHGLDRQVFGCPLIAQQNGFFRRVRHDHFTVILLRNPGLGPGLLEMLTHGLLCDSRSPRLRKLSIFWIGA